MNGLASTAWAASGGSRCGRRWAAFRRPDGDPRADNRLDIVHVNELKGGDRGDRASARIRQHSRPLARADSASTDESAIAVGEQRIGFSAAACPGDVAWGDLGCDIVLECTGKFLKPGAACRPISTAA